MKVLHFTLSEGGITARLVEEDTPRQCHYFDDGVRCEAPATHVSRDGDFCQPHWVAFHELKISILDARIKADDERAAKARATRAANKKKRKKQRAASQK